MSTPVPLILSTLPAFYSMVYTDSKGNLTDQAYLFMDQTWQQLSQIINNGVVMMSATTAQITDFGNNAMIPVGTIWFNTDLIGGPKLQVKTAAGTIETITSS